MNVKQPNNPNIPLIFFAFAFFVVLLGLFSKYSSQSVNVKNISQVSSAKSASITVTTQKIKNAIDFSRTVECISQKSTASISALIQGSEIFAKLGETTFLVSGDCLYRWQLGQKTGSKTCGVGQYVSMGKILLNSGLLTDDSAGDIAKKMGGSSLLTSFDIQKLLNTCKNVGEVKKETFTIPQEILFK